MRCFFEETVDILVEAAIHCEIDPVKALEKLFFLGLIFLYVHPSAAFFKFLICKAHFTPIADEYSTNYKDILPWLNSFYTMPIMAIIFTIACFLLNLATIIALGIHKAKSRSTANNQQSAQNK
uniref:Transmembrane protein 18 n=1 Tax=Ditylenchus dipsaci TaxID=166011 RepID=A0A915E666_9BILA